jgi:ankyrin repeat protein
MKKIFQLCNEDADHIRLAFFFHRRGTSLQRTQIGMFQTLLHQLLTQVPSAGTEFRSLYEDKKRLGRFGMDWGWNVAELQQIFKSAVLIAAKSHSIRIFVDALDEAGEVPARRVVSYLYELNELLEPDAVTSICFSCRHYPIVTTNSGFQICVEDENHEDINAYVLSELENYILWQDQRPTRDVEILRADISGMASGVFLWAVLVLPMVAKRYNKGESLETVQEALRKVPSDLGDVYQHILAEIVDPEDRAQRLHLMQWICLAERPLSLTELRFALASDDSSIRPSQYSCQESKGFIKDDKQMEKKIIGLSGGLAEVKHHKVQFIHQSVNDFLTTGGLRYLDPNSTEDFIGLGHHRLSRSCINYLRLGEVLRADRKRNDWVTAPGLPFIYYATTSWFLHAEKAESCGISQHELAQLFGFPQQVFESWIKIYTAIDPSSDKCPMQGSSLLHIASSSNLQSTIRILFQNGISVDEEDSYGNRALHHAARWGHKALTSMLLDYHAEIGAKNKYESTPLERAAGNGHEEVVWLLLERGADINERTGDSGNALQVAALKGHATMVQTLVESGADINSQGGQYGNALQAASAGGHNQIVQWLLEKGADVNAQGGEYGNALQAASAGGHDQIVQWLLEKGADVNAQGGWYGNALQAASAWGHDQIVQRLLEKGADVNAQGGWYGNALQAASAGGHDQIVEQLNAASHPRPPP